MEQELEDNEKNHTLELMSLSPKNVLFALSGWSRLKSIQTTLWQK
jgi:hypothetical protein